MKVLQIDEKNAKGLFEKASPEFRQTLIDTFGEAFFSKKITDRIKTFEDACEICPPSENMIILLDYNGIDTFMVGAKAALKLFIISNALNEGWEPNWNDSNEYKWYPYFKFGSGFGFSGSAYVNWGTNAGVGSRLCFKSKELAEYAGKQFEEIYNEFLNLK